MVSTSSTTYYTLSCQKYLEIQLYVGAATLLSIYKDEELSVEAPNWYLGYLKFIEDEIGYKDQDLNDDFMFLQQQIINALKNQKDNSLITQSLCYGASMFICVFTEKLMRIRCTQIGEIVKGSNGTACIVNLD